jgi:hypothetical protein
MFPRLLKGRCGWPDSQPTLARLERCRDNLQGVYRRTLQDSCFVYSKPALASAAGRAC